MAANVSLRELALLVQLLVLREILRRCSSLGLCGGEELLNHSVAASRLNVDTRRIAGGLSLPTLFRPVPCDPPCSGASTCARILL